MDEVEGRRALLGQAKADARQVLSYQRYRVAYRAIARGTDTRTMIGTILPRDCFSSHSLNVFFEPVDEKIQLMLLAFLNSFSFDYFLRQQVSANLTMFFIYQCPVPRLSPSDSAARSLIHRAARLICTSPEFDDLAKEVGLRDHRDGATDPVERTRLRAELDGLIAHLYSRTKDEYAHILDTFPLVPESEKQAARNAFSDMEKGLIQ